MRPIQRVLEAVRYRLGQFVRACGGSVAQSELKRASSVLPPQARALFLRQARHDQRHEIAVHDALISAGHTAPGLLQAALLHDVGKAAGGVPLLARGFIVVLRRLAPRLADRLGRGPARGWRRAFVVLAAHPQAGARMAEQAGCAPLTVSLIRRHEEPVAEVGTEEDRLLAALQAADAES